MSDLPDGLATAVAERYTIECELGRGGMATVYRAWDRKHERPVAVKVLRRDIAAVLGPERFLREIRLAAALQHPHILPLHDSGAANDYLYYVMPYVEGESLRQRLERERQLPVEEALRVGAEVADALSHAHSRGIVHRDIKPENILLAAGHAVVADFGIARAIDVAGGDKLTQTGITLGTPAYMSPEQAAGDPQTDGRSDLYSLGCVLYEMLAGAPPFTGHSAQAILVKHLTEPAPRLTPLRDVAASLEQVIRRCLAKAAADRFTTAAELRQALEAAREAKPGPPVRPPFPRPRSVLVWPAVALVLTGAVYLANRGAARPGGAAPAASARTRLAVLPLVNMSADPRNDYFTDGMTEELISTLSQIGGVRVIAGTSVLPYRDQRKSVAEIGRELRVGSVLEGSVRKTGDRVRITAQLIDVATQEHVWSAEYDRSLRDVFAIQSDVARRVADALQSRLTGDDGRATVPTTSVAAYDSYLRGLYYAQKVVDPASEQATRDSAILMLERAVQNDPRFALGYAILGRQYARKYFTSSADKRLEQRGFVAVEKALALDPHLAQAYHARALLAWTLANGFPHEQAVRDLRRALELNPSLAEAHYDLARVYLHIGLLEKAREEAQAAELLDPATTSRTRPRIGLIDWSGGAYTAALAGLENAPGWEPDLAQVLHRLGRTREAFALLDSVLRATPPQALAPDAYGVYALLLAARGDQAGAQGYIERAIASGQGRSHFHHAEYAIAAAYVQMGDRARALEWLRRTAADGMPCYPLFAKDPMLDPLRRDPAFIAFLDQLKIQHERYQRTL